MKLRALVVTVKQLPEGLNVKQWLSFYSELESYISIDRPRIVLDCSKVLQMDKSAIRLLLGCLEEAMKRNGDVKLVALPADTRTTLTLTGVDRLFETFDTIAEAVNSFCRLPDAVDSNIHAPRISYRASECAE